MPKELLEQRGLDMERGGVCGPPSTLVLLSLQPQYYEQILAGIKTHEYRRRFLRCPTELFVYVSSPVQAIRGRLRCGSPIFEPVDRLCELADGERPGAGRSLAAYLSGLDRGYALPILAVEELAPLGLEELRARFPGFRPPQSYLLLDNCPALRDLLLARARAGAHRQDEGL